MKYYFELQFVRIKRLIRDLGIHPVLGIILGTGQFIFMSVIIFKKITNPQYVYSFLSLLFVLPLGNGLRNEFLKNTFSRNNYRLVRLIENVLTIIPFCIFLLIK